MKMLGRLDVFIVKVPINDGFCLSVCHLKDGSGQLAIEVDRHINPCSIFGINELHHRLLLGAFAIRPEGWRFLIARVFLFIIK